MAKDKRRKVVTEVVPICMDTIGELDNGNTRRMVDKEIQLILSDLSDRGEEDGKPRCLVLNVEFIKVNGRLIITPRVGSKLPPRVANSTSAREQVREKDGLVEVLFQPFNAENADQPSFATEEAEEN